MGSSGSGGYDGCLGEEVSTLLVLVTSSPPEDTLAELFLSSTEAGGASLPSISLGFSAIPVQSVYLVSPSELGSNYFNYTAKV